MPSKKILLTLLSAKHVNKQQIQKIKFTRSCTNSKLHSLLIGVITVCELMPQWAAFSYQPMVLINTFRNLLSRKILHTQTTMLTNSERITKLQILGEVTKL